MPLLNANDIRIKLEKQAGWFYSDNHIIREFQFKDFKEVLSFVIKVGEAAEVLDHHPDILMHGWNKVKISITTHNERGITDKDFLLAEKIESLL